MKELIMGLFTLLVLVFGLTPQDGPVPYLHWKLILGHTLLPLGYVTQAVQNSIKRIFALGASRSERFCQKTSSIKHLCCKGSKGGSTF